MKVLITNYTFDSNARTIEFNDYGSISLEAISTITNVTRGKIIFQPNTSGLGGWVDTNILHLQLDTRLMQSADTLQIYYDDPLILPQAGANIHDGLGNAINSQNAASKRSLYITLLDGSGNPINSMGGGGGSSNWGDIGGDINNQTDLQTEFEETREFAIAMAIAL